MKYHLVKKEPLINSLGEEIPNCYFSTYISEDAKNKLVLLRSPWFKEEDVSKIFFDRHNEDGKDYHTAVFFVHDKQNDSYYSVEFFVKNNMKLPVDMFDKKFWYAEPVVNRMFDKNEFLLTIDSYDKIRKKLDKPSVFFHDTGDREQER